MTTITATANPAAGTVTVTIVKTEAITSLIRADANGTRKVRATAGMFPSAGTTGTLTITDHEAAFTGPVTYRAGTATPVSATFPPGLLPRITIPNQPELGVWVNTVHGYESGRESAGTVHTVLGRRFPIVTEAAMTARQGSLEIILPTHQAANELEAVLDRGKTLQLRQATHAGMDMYFSARNARKETEEGIWKLTADYVEVDVPPGDRAAFGSWTFATVAALPGATFSTLPDTFETFPDLAVGETA